jgi:hypothetical protein
MKVICRTCSFENVFAQEYAYHAGLSNLGFLYNDNGNLTLVWSSFDPDYESIVGEKHPWALSSRQRAVLEATLKPAPFGGNWSFKNVPRCTNCHKPIGQSIIDTIYYLVFPSSLELDDFTKGNGFKKVLK